MFHHRNILFESKGDSKKSTVIGIYRMNYISRGSVGLCIHVNLVINWQIDEAGLMIQVDLCSERPYSTGLHV